MGATAKKDNVVKMPGAQDPELEQRVKRVLALKSEQKAISREIREVYDKCEGLGHDKKVLKKVIGLIELGLRLENPSEFWLDCNNMLRAAGYRQLCLWD